MKAVRKKPGEPPEIVEVENTLETLQKEVGGYIQAVPFSTDCAIICNEEGKLIPLEPTSCFAVRRFLERCWPWACGARAFALCGRRRRMPL